MALHPFRCQTIDDRCAYIGIAIATEVRIAMIVAQQQQDIWPIGGESFTHTENEEEALNIITEHIHRFRPF